MRDELAELRGGYLALQELRQRRAVVGGDQPGQRPRDVGGVGGDRRDEVGQPGQPPSFEVLPEGVEREPAVLVRFEVVEAAVAELVTDPQGQLQVLVVHGRLCGPVVEVLDRGRTAQEADDLLADGPPGGGQAHLTSR
ncbi:hypothetical protein OG439_06385 [Amycolatopsis sp. NBC_01307]|uniref:hypothetical protein n=1 Tax=Amycolatopsis sp. NBC_01307 TaxID=2903561 RepID=UPI002E157A3E|nr:hypothetical protein OG439_06385 [Amycolatopsis sp. NBC_01307]